MTQEEQTYKPSMRALELLVREMTNQGVKDPEEVSQRIHAASLLSMIKAVHGVIGDEIMPTPLYRLSYDPDNNNVDFELLDGRAKVPRKYSIDITVLDMVMAAHLRDKIPLLFEGITGVGKTFTVEQYLKTTLPPEFYKSLRLNFAMSNVQQPYIRGEIKDGMLYMYLRKDALRQIAALFIDEQNRGDTNQILQLLDGQVALSTGERGDAGTYIPQLQWKLDAQGNKTDETEVTYSENGLKKVVVLSAQNPARADDPKYSQTVKTDQATANRNLVIDSPNPTGSIGSSLMLVRDRNKQHPRFLDEYVRNMSEYLGIKADELRSILLPTGGEKPDKTAASEWLSLHAFTTDPSKTQKQILKSALELSDFLIYTLSGDLQASFKEEASIAKGWTEALAPYRVNLEYATDFNPESEKMKRVSEVFKSLEEQVINRDIAKSKKLADALATIKDFRRALKAPQPVAAYLGQNPYITVEDIASSFAIMLNDKKQRTSQADPVELVNTVLTEYISLFEDYARDIRAGITRFDVNNASVGLRNLALLNVLYSVKDADGRKKPDEYAKAMIESVGRSVDILKRLDQGSDVKRMMIARTVADLATLAGFIDQSKTELAQELSQYFKPDKTKQLSEQLNAFGEYVQRKRQDPTTEPIYHHRLTRIVGK